MVPAAEAIRGHRSAHSLATGPVMAEPFISPLGFTITPEQTKELRRKVEALLSVWVKGTAQLVGKRKLPRALSADA